MSYFERSSVGSISSPASSSPLKTVLCPAHYTGSTKGLCGTDNIAVIEKELTCRPQYDIINYIIQTDFLRQIMIANVCVFSLCTRWQYQRLGLQYLQCLRSCWVHAVFSPLQCFSDASHKDCFGDRTNMIFYLDVEFNGNV